MAASETRVLIVVFDALRPEFLNAELMPNLWGFASQGVRYSDSHSTFPTETRVNQSAVTTGCMSRGHGITGNTFVASELGQLHALNTGDDVALEAAVPRLTGGLLRVPTLSEHVAAAGRVYASLSTGTSGGARLINHRAADTGQFRLAMRRPEATVPASALGEITALVGKIPANALPALDWVTWCVSAYLDYVEAEILPDVMVLWLSEPDETFHKFGIGSPESLDAIAHVDRLFGRILAHHETALCNGTMHIVAMSDHGQTTLAGDALDLRERFSAAGFPAVGAREAPVCNVLIHNAGGVWFGDDHGAAVRDAVAWLQEQAWCGPIFTRDGLDGTLDQAAIGLDHARAPDISVVMRATEAPNAWGIRGTTVHDAPYPVGGGCHGGLSRAELHNVLTLGGSAFRQGTVIDVPAGNIDVTPTVLALLGRPVPTHFDGRVLVEAFAGIDQAEQVRINRQIQTSTNGTGVRTFLETVDVSGTSYLHSAWVE